MKREVLAILRKTYLDYGKEVFCDRNRLNAFLGDLLYEYPHERKKISLAINENMAYKIITEVTAENPFRINVFIEELVECYELPRNVATDIINTLCYSITGKKYMSKTIEKILKELYYSPDEAVEKEYADEIYLAAQEGNADAQYRVGNWFETGKIVEKNMFMAKEWYTKAAENKHCWAIHNLGRFCEIEENETDALKYYRTSLNFGEIQSAYNIALYYKNKAKNKEPHEKVECYTLAIKYLKKGTDIVIPKYNSSYKVFLKIKYECAKQAAFLCKDIFDIIMKREELKDSFDMKANVETSKYFMNIQKDTANVMRDMYNLTIDKMSF